MMENANPYIEGLGLGIDPIRELDEMVAVIKPEPRTTTNGKNNGSVQLQLVSIDSAKAKQDLTAFPEFDRSKLDLDTAINLQDEQNIVVVFEKENGNPVLVGQDDTLYKAGYRKPMVVYSPNTPVDKNLAPGLQAVESKTWRPNYGKEVVKRMMEGQLGDIQMNRLLKHEAYVSFLASTTFEELKETILSQSPADYWQETHRQMYEKWLGNMQKSSKSNGANGDKDFPPHMQLNSQEEQAQYITLLQLSKIADDTFRSIARYRLELGQDQEIPAEYIQNLKASLTKEEIDQHNQTMAEAAQGKNGKDKKEVAVREKPTTVENLLEYHAAEPQIVTLGPVARRTDVESYAYDKEEQKYKRAEFYYVPEYQRSYPPVVHEALARIYDDYNNSFRRLVEMNREWETDYQYAMSPNGKPLNRWVQIDMVSLPDGFLQEVGGMNVDELVRALRPNIFEYENSLAMYGLLQRLFSYEGQPSRFDTRFRQALDMVRQQYGKPIALLAVTDAKYQAMLRSEFGTLEDHVSDEDVQRLSGFDTFFGPEEFMEYLEQNNGKSDYLLYARTSLPVDKIKNPDLYVDNPLLASERYRRIIKAHALTFNVDNPEWPLGDPRRINDTKMWMGEAGIAFEVHQPQDLYSPRLLQDLASRGYNLDEIIASGDKSKNEVLGKLFSQYPPEQLLSEPFKAHLKTRGIDPMQIAKGERAMRFKPGHDAYGAYAHLINVGANAFATYKALATEIGQRGAYVAQPELVIPTVQDAETGDTYMTIERNFAFTPDGENYYDLSGFISLMPSDSIEAKKKRNHGSKYTKWAERT
jgi:hypothetical protein